MKKLTVEEAKQLFIAHLKAQLEGDLKQCGDVGIEEETKEMYAEDICDVECCDTVRDLWDVLTDLVWKDEQKIEILKALIYERKKTKRTKGK